MLVTDMCTGDVDDETNAAQKAMYGLTRWLVDNNRVVEAEEGPKVASPTVGPDYHDSDDDIPF